MEEEYGKMMDDMNKKPRVGDEIGGMTIINEETEYAYWKKSPKANKGFSAIFDIFKSKSPT